MKTKLLLAWLNAVIYIHCAESYENETKVKSRIIGGEDVYFNDYPYMAAIFKRRNSYFICGGTIIQKNWILTAGHCTLNVTAKQLYVRIGSRRADKGGQRIRVLTVVVHPKFNLMSADNDFALIGLGNKMMLSHKVAVLEMPNENYKIPLPGAFVLILGWGHALKPPEQQFQMLRFLEMPIIDLKSCQKKYLNDGSDVTDTMFCTDGTFQKHGACYGDSGGPAVHNEKLIGVISWIKDCEHQNYPLVFQRVHLARKWIDQSIYDYTYKFNDRITNIIHNN